MALDVLRRIGRDGAYANLALGTALERSKLRELDRGFVTELVYGSTRMRRACDVIVDRFVTTPPDDDTRRLLRLGAYQLAFAGVAPHAAVSETVALAPRRTRGFINAVLRKVAAQPMAPSGWPSLAAELSYPDWIVDLLQAELGDDADATLRRMNEAPPVTMRDDGYTQDLSSQWVAANVEAAPGERVLDLCAAPGGKATALAAAGATVTAADVRSSRSGLVAGNAERTGQALHVVTADGRHPPFADASFDAVLIDAPCSGLGALRRRADARWRIEATAVDELAALQRELLTAAAPLVRPGGRLVYSVCTLTARESIEHPTPAGFEVDSDPLPAGPEPDAAHPDGWRRFGQGWRVLPHDADTDGMVVIRYRRSA